MRFSVARDTLLAGLQTVQNVVSSRTTLPILSNVRIQAADGQLRFTTTDLDVGVTCVAEAQVDRPGGTTLPVKRLASIVRELPTGEVHVEVEGKNIAS
ncbi:MAG: DNA polymerase III subunit beta, partial [Verrucomicrobiota bacterium]